LELKIKQEEYNALLKRKEIYAEVDHDQAGTPSRTDLRKAVASKYGVKPETVYIIDVETRTGTQSAVCKAQVYDDKAGALRIVPKYIQTRNLPLEERKLVKEQQAQKAEAAPKAEKPNEKPKEEKTKQETKTPPEAAKKEKEPERK
jgi:small subunit ribosomal protein S24e